MMDLVSGRPCDRDRDGAIWRSAHWRLFLPGLLCGVVASSGSLRGDTRATANPAEPITIELPMDPGLLGPEGPLWGQVPLFHRELPLSSERPADVIREPAYRGQPRYATFDAGNGPDSRYLLALDEPEDGTGFRLYIDLNRNGDLTDDGDGRWQGETTARNGHVRLGPHPVTVRASWGNRDVEVAAGPYGFIFYRSGQVGAMPDTLTMRRQAGRAGEIALDGRTYRAALIENDSDAVFAKPLGTDGRPLSGRESRPVHLLIDLDGNGRFDPNEYFDVRGPVVILGTAYRCRVMIDGSRLLLYPGGTAPVAAPGQRPVLAPPALLPAGTPAPDFTAEGPDGQPVRLADLRGKVVVLDFWATWCGPCIRAMPKIQSIHERRADAGVAVLGLCVFDQRQAYDTWRQRNRDRFTFPTAFDPKGREPGNIAASLYRVTSIPTLYVIDRDGRIVEGIRGFLGDTDTRLDEALARAGINPEPDAPDLDDTHAPPPGPISPPGDAPYADWLINDRNLRAGLQRQAETLHRNGRTVPLSRLLSEMDADRGPIVHGPVRPPNHPDWLALREAVVVVGTLYQCDQCPNWHTTVATGFFLSETGLVATCHHVVNQPGHETVVVMTFDGRVHPVRQIVAADPGADLALLRIDGSGFRALPLSTDAPPGTPVRLISHPGQRFYVLSEGLLSRYYLQPRSRQPRVLMAITADFARGSSGAPVLDPQGRVVGVAASTQSLYHEVTDGVQRNLQMVVRQCTPSHHLIQLLRHP